MEFQHTHRQMFERVQTMSDEDLRTPVARFKGNSLLAYIKGDTFEHYEEHGRIIHNWLKQHNGIQETDLRS